IRGLLVLARVRLEMRLEYPSERAFHVLPNARCALTSTSPPDVALVPPAQPGSCNKKWAS
ncbi:MAG: hypothetical protein ACXWC3_30535, partial [Burkholderiales bacterium]